MLKYFMIYLTDLSFRCSHISKKIFGHDLAYKSIVITDRLSHIGLNPANTWTNTNTDYILHMVLSHLNKKSESGCDKRCMLSISNGI